MAGRGRKPKIAITPEITKEICACISAGMTKRAAMEGLLDESTFYDYINKGERDIAKGKDSVYAEFAKGVKKAEKSFVLSNLRVIKEAASAGTWQAAAWALERSRPDEYGKNRLEITGAEGKPVEVENTVHVYLPDNGRDNNKG